MYQFFLLPLKKNVVIENVSLPVWVGLLDRAGLSHGVQGSSPPPLGVTASWQ